MYSDLNTSQNDVLLSPAEFARRLGVSKATLYRHVIGQVTVVQISPRRIGIPASEVGRFINDRRSSGSCTP